MSVSQQVAEEKKLGMSYLASMDCFYPEFLLCDFLDTGGFKGRDPAMSYSERKPQPWNEFESPEATEVTVLDGYLHRWRFAQHQALTASNFADTAVALFLQAVEQNVHLPAHKYSVLQNVSL